MSRLIVKNLPKHLTEERLRTHFERKGGEVTDVKILRKPDGESRKFGFVGFRSNKDGSTAKKYFDSTYIDTSKIIVETAKPYGDQSIPRPWSKYSEGSSAHSRADGNLSNSSNGQRQRLTSGTINNDDDAERIKKAVKEAELEKFLEAVKPRAQRKGQLWSNEDIEMTVAQRKRSIEAAAAAAAAAADSSSSNKKRARKKKGGGDSNREDGPGKKKRRKTKTAGGQKVMVSESVRSNRRHGGDGLSVVNKHIEFLSSDDEEEEEDDGGKKEKEGGGDSTDDDEYEDMPMKGTRGIPEEEEEEEEDRDDACDFDDNADDSVNSEAPAGGDADNDDNAEVTENLGDSGRLFVRNLSYATTEEDITKLFSKFGELSEVHIPMNADTKKSKGFSYVLFLIPENAVTAQTALDGQVFQGRLLHVIAARNQPERKYDDDPNGASSSYKRKKDAELKANATDTKTWNPLFMRTDAVMGAMADRFDMEKQEIMDPKAGNLAVRVALGETNIIRETKELFEKEGIDLELLTMTEKRKAKRSKLMILVKNLPGGTKEEELRLKFSKFGDLDRVIVPPSGAIALIEYLHANEAKKAFRTLAYSKFRNAPLFLEWAPLEAVKRKRNEGREEIKQKKKEDKEQAQNPRTRQERTKKETSKEIDTAEEEEESLMEGKTENSDEEEDVSDDDGGDDDNGDNDDDDETEDSTTLYVKNLKFSTTEDALLQAFSKFVKVRSVRIAKQKDMRNKGKMRSLGYGFVELRDRSDAVKAMKRMQGALVDKHKISLKFAKSPSAAAETKKRKDTDRESEDTRRHGKPSPKIMVKNLAFEATKKDIRELFAAFGQVKSVRVPKKFDGSSRGFGFVEFLTKQEAINAMKHLSNTHLYGRHLVLNYAAAERNVEALQEKARKEFQQVQEQNA